MARYNEYTTPKTKTPKSSTPSYYDQWRKEQQAAAPANRNRAQVQQQIAARSGSTTPQASQSWLGRAGQWIGGAANKFVQGRNAFANATTNAATGLGRGIQQGVSNLANTDPRDLVTAFGNWSYRNNPNKVNPYANGGADFRADQQQRERDASGQIFGVHYGPNWVRPDYVPDPSLRSGELAGIQMTNDEYIRRRNALEPLLQTDRTPRQYQGYTGNNYQAWVNKAARSPNVSHDIYSQWRADNPRPSGFFQTDQEYTLRQNAAPVGYGYQPFGSSYYKKPQQTSANVVKDQNYQGRYDGSGYYGGRGGYYGGGGGGWGGGGGGGGYSQAQSFYNQMANWRILQVQGG